MWLQVPAPALLYVDLRFYYGAVMEDLDKNLKHPWLGAWSGRSVRRRIRPVLVTSYSARKEFVTNLLKIMSWRTLASYFVRILTFSHCLMSSLNAASHDRCIDRPLKDFYCSLRLKICHLSSENRSKNRFTKYSRVLCLH